MAVWASDDTFKRFGKLLEQEIERYKSEETVEDKNLFYKQKRQFETLIKLEKEFRLTLVKHTWGSYVYKKFIQAASTEKEDGGLGSILAVKPYFRERQKVCIGAICKAVKESDWKKLQTFDVNYLFVRFTLKQKVWGPTSKVKVLADKIKKLREEIIVSNMPLSISRAKLFWGRAGSRDPNQVLTYMDFVQHGTEGLISAIDKYTLPFKANFRASVVQWCTGTYIEAFSLDKDTILNDINGNSKSIKDFGPGNKIQGVDNNGNKIVNNVLKLHDNGIKEGYEVEFDDGYKIVCSENHKFLTKEGMKPLYEIVSKKLKVLSG